MEVKRSTFLHQNPKLAEEKAFFTRANRHLEPRENDKASKCYQQKAIVRDIDGRPLFPPKSSRYDQKPWPTKVPIRADELVKHMSNVPGYLQRVEKGDNTQEKALNFGVLDWRRLEKWTGDHRHVIDNEKAAASPASSSISSLPMYGSSGQSCRSSGSSHVAQRPQSPSLNHHQDPSTEEDYKQISQEEAPWNSMGCYSSEIAYKRCPIRHRIPPSAGKYIGMDTLVAKFDESKQQKPGVHSSADDVRSPPGAPSLPSRLQACATLNSANESLKLLDAVSDQKEKKSGDWGYECPRTSVCTEENCPEANHSGFSQSNDDMFGHFQNSAHNSRRFSFESTESGHVIQKSGYRSSLGTSSTEDFQFATHSSPFPCDSQSECSDVNICAGSEVSCDSANSPPHLDSVTIVRSNGRQENHDKPSNGPRNKCAAKTSEKWDWNGLKTVTKRGGESLPNCNSGGGLSGMIRSSSLSTSSAMRQRKAMSSGRHDEDKAADSGRGRQSPLRRLLDPLLKPKALCRTRSTRLVAASSNQPSCEYKLPIQEELTSTHVPHSSYNAGTNSGDGACDKGSISASRVPLDNLAPVHDGKHETSMKQALMRLAWKNGLPLLTFSVNERDILAATRREGTSLKQGYDYIYTFYYVHEIKKKTGGWISQGNKGKRKGLISRVVGQMTVSCRTCPRTRIRTKEFTLFGPELSPTAQEALEPVPDSELAAIVVRVPAENVESSIGDVPQENKCRDQSKADSAEDKFACQPVERPETGQNLQMNNATIVAILPSEVHGLSEGGKPSPLVERWKSGGLCDCGGWDVGCSLSILTNKLQDGGHVVQSCRTTDGTHCVELFTQGGDQKSRPVFSLVAFKEELYTVHFHGSIATLQAFGACVALLHSGKQMGPSELQDSQCCTPVEASPPLKDPARKQVGPSSMSVPYHPPLSPVGRA